MFAPFVPAYVSHVPGKLISLSMTLSSYRHVSLGDAIFVFSHQITHSRGEKVVKNYP
jgi:hypothetical protein